MLLKMEVLRMETIQTLHCNIRRIFKRLLGNVALAANARGLTLCSAEDARPAHS